MNKNPEITARTKETIAKAFCILYSEKSIDKITVKEITDKAGYNRSTFYQHFTDIYNLLEYVENDLISRIKSGIEGELPPDTAAKWGLNPNLEQLLEFFSDKECYLKAVLGDYGSSHFIAQLKKNLPLDKLIDIPPVSEKFVPYLIEFHIAISLSLFRVWSKNGKNISKNELLHLIHALYTKGISPFYQNEEQ